MLPNRVVKKAEGKLSLRDIAVAAVQIVPLKRCSVCGRIVVFDACANGCET